MLLFHGILVIEFGINSFIAKKLVDVISWDGKDAYSNAAIDACIQARYRVYDLERSLEEYVKDYNENINKPVSGPILSLPKTQIEIQKIRAHFSSKLINAPIAPGSILPIMQRTICY